MKWFSCAGSVILIVWGFLFVYISEYTKKEVNTARQWPTTKGVIVKATVAGRDFTIRYEYQVKDDRFIGNRVFPLFAWSESATWNQDDQAVELILTDSKGTAHFFDYSVGDRVRVFYDPHSPKKALLVPYAPFMKPFLYTGFIFVLLGLLFCRNCLEIYSTESAIARALGKGYWAIYAINAQI